MLHHIRRSAAHKELVQRAVVMCPQDDEARMQVVNFSQRCFRNRPLVCTALASMSCRMQDYRKASIFVCSVFGDGATRWNFHPISRGRNLWRYDVQQNHLAAESGGQLHRVV